MGDQEPLILRWGEITTDITIAFFDNTLSLCFETKQMRIKKNRFLRCVLPTTTVCTRCSVRGTKGNAEPYRGELILHCSTDPSLARFSKSHSVLRTHSLAFYAAFRSRPSLWMGRYLLISGFSPKALPLFHNLLHHDPFTYSGLLTPHVLLCVIELASNDNHHHDLGIVAF